MIIRWSSIVFAALIFIAALLQFNDPDPVPWVIFYLGATAVLAISAVKSGASLHKLMVVFGASLAGIGLAWCLWILAVNWQLLTNTDLTRVTRSMSDSHPGNELLREMGGLLLASAMLLWNSNSLRD